MTGQTSLPRFIILWSGQLLSMIGIGLTAFTLAVYAFEKTNTASAVAMITLFAFVPNILLRPIGGVFADRYDRRLMMMIGDAGAAGGLLFIYIMLKSGSLELWYIYTGVFTSSVFSALQAPSYRAIATDMLDESDYSKGSGLIQLAESSKFLLSPILAGVLISFMTIDTILMINMLTYVAAILAVVAARGKQSRATVVENKEAWYKELFEGWRIIAQNRGVLLLIIVISVVTFYIGFLETLVGPMILSFTSAKALGIFHSSSAIGMLISSVLLGLFTIKRHTRILVIALAVAGLAFAMLGTTRNIYVLTGAGFVFLGALPFINTSADVLVRRNIPNDKQGRVWGIIGIVSQLGFIAAYSSAGVLADKLFNPWLSNDGALAQSIGMLIGVGPGRGIAFLFIIAGLLVIVMSCITSRIQAIRMLEKH